MGLKFTSCVDGLHDTSYLIKCLVESLDAFTAEFFKVKSLENLKKDLENQFQV